MAEPSGTARERRREDCHEPPHLYLCARAVRLGKL